METGDKKRFTAAMAACSEVHDRKLTDELLRVYFDALSDLQIEMVEYAVRECLRKLKWFPKPCDIRERCKTSDNAIEQRIESAWQACLAIGKRDFWNQSLTIADPALAATIRSMGGLDAIRRDEFAVYNRKRFEDAYRMNIGVTNNQPFSQGDISNLRKVNYACDYIEDVGPRRITSGTSPIVEGLASSLRITAGDV